MTRVDLDLHGYVGIRLLNATPRDVATVVRQLGPLVAPLDRDPDILVTFADRVDHDRRLTYVGVGDAGFSGDAFYVLRGRTKVPGRARIPMQDVGGCCEIVCERTLPAVPLLLPIVNFTALAKGLLPLHATAFLIAGRGVLATGWSKGGKTELLLAGSGVGARYVGDEWVYLTPDGSMFGVPEPIRLWRWQLDQLPEVRLRLTRRERLRLHGLGAVTTILRSAALVPGAPGSVLRRAEPILARQLYVQVPPARLFGDRDAVATAPLDRLVFVTSHEPPDVSLTEVHAPDVASRMLASLQEEREPFMAYYRQFRFAFPDLSSPVVEEATAFERRLMDRALSGRQAWHLGHPYPVDIDALVEPLLHVIGQETTAPAKRAAALIRE
ncbi:MAG TPA: hypothetical protein VFX33_07785 [Actinomycetales bacterium]|nr:hypothetical protein [Actinomycetales bacterium]